MATLLRRLSKSSSSLGILTGFKQQQHTHSSGSRRIPFAAAAASASVSCGIVMYYYGFSSSPLIAHMEEEKEESKANVALDPEKWLEFKLSETARVSHNTKLFRFTFDSAKKLGLDVASCLLTRAQIGEESDGKKKYVIRPYTPISDPDSKGYFDLLIKVYPEGKMSQHFASLKTGDTLEVKGPIEKLRYTPNMKKQIGMVAGGSGITPMFQVIKAVLKNPDDITQVSLIYANVSPDDILLKNELDKLASYPNFKVFYTVDNPTKNWKGGAGYVSKDMALKGLPGPGPDSLILVCGPPGMMNHVSGGKAKDWSQGEVSGVLKELGYTEEMVYKF
ncbi:hypothetical protein LUZ60_009677 [Juncus effusus]|nr:hypothetical protein LUZ60_009677 [Juncus effusus]